MLAGKGDLGHRRSEVSCGLSTASGVIHFRSSLSMASPSPVLSSSAPIDPGGAPPKKFSTRDNQLLNLDLEMKLQSPGIQASIPAAKVPSYAARFKSSLRNLRKISAPSFLEDGTPVVQAPESVLLQTSELWKDHVVAHFHGRRPSAAKIIADLNPVWGKFGNITVRTVNETCVLIFIPSVQTREWVLQVGYWQADRCAFSVYPWTPDGNLAAQELLFAPTWAVLKNVPPQLYSLDGISVVASGIGEPLHTEKSRLDPYHFGDTKVKVEIDLSKSPPEVVEVRDTPGNAVRVNVEYPSLPPRCLNCGKFGHLINRCRKAPMQKPQSQKKDKVISVVNSVEKVSSEEAIQEEEVVVVSEEGQLKKSRARSRSHKRSQSRTRARARALSSPPEAGSSEVLAFPVTAVVESKAKELEVSSVVVCEQTQSVKGSEAVTEVHQLEEGEICEVEEVGVVQAAECSKGVQSNLVEEESVWFTKHSKNYRRALRKHNVWLAEGAVGSPPKSSRFLTRGASLGQKLEN